MGDKGERGGQYTADTLGVDFRSAESFTFRRRECTGCCSLSAVVSIESMFGRGDGAVCQYRRDTSHLRCLL